MNYTASDHVKAIYDHMKCSFIDIILVNNKPIPPEIQLRYKQEYAEPVNFDVHTLEKLGLQLVEDEIVLSARWSNSA